MREFFDLVLRRTRANLVSADFSLEMNSTDYFFFHSAEDPSFARKYGTKTQKTNPLTISSLRK